MATQHIVYPPLPATVSNALTGLTGDVVATGPGTGTAVVIEVGGQSAADIASSVSATQDAASINDPNALVIRDGTGSFAAQDITAEGEFIGDLTGNADTATFATSSGAFTGNLAGDVTGPQGSTEVAFVGTKSAADVDTSVGLTQAATDLNIGSTLVKRSVGGSAALNITGNATNITGTLAVANGGTNSTAALSNNRIMQSSGGAIVEAAAITASRALASDANGIPVASATTATELGFVNGVTSAIQTQINGKQASGNYITALTGDVTATGPGSAAATVAAVGGQTATNVAAGAVLANAATSANTASAIVRRGASGQFAAGAITAVGVDATTGKFSQGPAAGANLNNYAITNAAGAVSTTNLNPGLLVFGGAWGMDLGYLAATARYRTRVFCESGGDISFATPPSLPTAQSSFAERMVIRGDTGNIGIGLNAPVAPLEVVAGGTNSSIKAGSFELQSIGTNNCWLGDNIYFDGSFRYRVAGIGTLAYFAIGDYSIFTAPSGLAGAAATLTPRLTVKNAGSVGIGTTGPTSLLSVNGTADKVGGGSWGTFSDARLKDISGSFDYGLAAINDLNTVRYTFKPNNILGQDSTKPYVGFIAQEVQAVIPEAVTVVHCKDHLDKDAPTSEVLTLNQDYIILALVNAVKELSAKNDELANRLAALEEYDNV